MVVYVDSFPGMPDFVVWPEGSSTCYLNQYKMILATEKVIAATLKVILAATKVISATEEVCKLEKLRIKIPR